MLFRSDDDEEDEEEEDWQKEAAAQLAAEAEEEEKRKEEEARPQKEQEEEELKEKEKAKGMPVLNMPNRVELSLDEGKALFKVSRLSIFLMRRRMLISITDSSTRERHQSFTTLGYRTPTIRLGPSIRPPSKCLSTARRIR